jgi:YHS domain-containing protein
MKPSLNLPPAARLRLLALVAVALLAGAALAPAPASAGGIVNSSLLGGVAIDGTDPVAYFTDGQPVQGSSDFEHEWMGATWRFVSAAHRDQFAADPEKYAPQYGGYCAWAVSQGYTAKIDPAAWKIVDGKLYLNYSPAVQSQWQGDIPGNVTKADANWPKIKADLDG